MTGEDGELSLVRRTGKSDSAFRTISEVADDLDVPQHVLRFWEGKFPQVKPLKRGGGRRYYRPDDVALLRRIRDLLYSEGYTIKGVQKLLKDGTGSAASAARDGGAPPSHSEAEPELGLEAAGADPHDDPATAVDAAPAPDSDASDEEAMPEAAATGSAALPPSAGGREIDPVTRHELRELLAELEQLRLLLQPR